MDILQGPSLEFENMGAWIHFLYKRTDINLGFSHESAYIRGKVVKKSVDASTHNFEKHGCWSTYTNEDPVLCTYFLVFRATFKIDWL